MTSNTFFSKPTEFEIKGQKFILYSEYAFSNMNQIKKISRQQKDTVYICGLRIPKGVFSVMVKNGVWQGEREKTHYTTFEKKDGLEERGWHFGTMNYNGIEILPILCYEICFPEDTMKSIYKPDVIVHHIGFPMYDKHQYEAWFALEKSLAVFYNCPVYASTGGEEKLGINGVISV